MLKPLTITAVFLCIVGTGLYFYELNQVEDPKTRSGQMLLNELDTKNLNNIRVRSVDGFLGFHQSQGGDWLVGNLDYPLDPEKIQDLLLELTEMKLGDLITDNPKHHARFKLTDLPETEEEWDETKHALSIGLLRGDDSLLFDLRFGKDREQGGGQYFRYAGENEVFLLPKTLYIDSDPNEWVDKKLVTIKKELLHKITIQHSGEKPFTLFYDNNSSIWSMGEEGKNLNSNEIESIEKRLGKLSFTRLSEKNLPDNETGRSKLSIIEIKLTDGKIYSLELGEEENKETNHVLTIRMSIEVDTDSEESRRQMETFNKKVSGRLYEIRSWEAKDLLKKRAEFLEGD